MPIYMDRHFVQGATAHAVANAHNADLAVQDKYRVKFLTYWFDEERSTAFCLVDAPDRDAIVLAHQDAHGLVPHEIIEVDPAVVEAFLGRVKDPVPVDPQAPELAIDAAFRAIMFTDLKDSTHMTTRLGDAKALHLLHVHNVLTRNALRATNGREVKHTGDGIMASFRQAPDAVQCAIAVQQGLAEHNRRHAEEPLFVRIGLNGGEPIEEDGDLFGNAVQLAARLCAQAQPGEILASELIHELCKHLSLPFEERGPVKLKGFEDEVKVYAIRSSLE